MTVTPGTTQKLIIGCGYLGLRVARAWLAAGEQVAALTRSEETARHFAAEGIQPVVGDVTKPETLNKLPAAETVLWAVGLDRRSGHSQTQVYVDGLANVRAVCGPRTRRFLYISSTSVYGQSAGEWIDETSPCAPARSNGQVCLQAEGLVWKHFPVGWAVPTNPGEASSSCPCYSTDLVGTAHPTANVLRLSGIYGPGRLLSRVESLRQGVPLTGNPEAFLNLIHVDDAMAAVLASAERGQPGQTYLVSDDGPLRRAEYYGLLARLVGAPSVTFVPLDPADPDAGGLNKRCRNAVLREQLGVRLQFPTAATGLVQALGLES